MKGEVKKKRKTKKKLSFDEKFMELIESSAENAERLERLGDLSDRLGDVIGAALDDSDQFKRYIVTERGRGADGETTSQNVERVFEKVDFKSVKEAAGAIRALADSVKSVWSTPDFGEPSASAPDEAAPLSEGITVTFENCEDFAR